MAKVIQMGGCTTVDIPPDTVLEAAKGKLDEVIVVGYSEENGYYFASSTSDRKEILWSLEQCKLELLSQGN